MELREPHVVEVVELKRSHHMFEGHPKDFRYQFADMEMMPVMADANKLIPMDSTFEVHDRYAKKFHINGEDKWIVWSMELETLVGKPLAMMDDLIYENNQLKKQFDNCSKHNHRLKEDVEKWQGYYCDKEDQAEEYRVEAHQNKVKAIIATVGFIMSIGVMVGSVLL